MWAPSAIFGQEEDSLDRSTGNSLYALCNDNRPFQNWVMRLLYCRFVDAFLLGRHLDIPAGVTHGQIIDVVKKYLTDHPATRNQASSILEYDALIDAFPQKQQKK